MHYYQFNIGDYSSHTKGLSLIEDLAYRRLIDEYYLSEQPFNGCSTDVARLIGMREYVSEVEYILSRYFVNEDGKWVHGRIDKEILEYREKQEKRSNAGKKSAESRQKSTSVEQVLIECSTDVQLTNNHKPLTINQDKKSTGDKSPISLNAWLEKIKTENLKAIPDDDPIFSYAEDAGIPNDWLRLCWIEFRTEFSENGKRQKDWRAHFRNFVRKNYYKLWWLDSGQYQLTSRGQQAMAAMQARSARGEQ